MTNDEILMLVAEVMTSGIKQDGARYTLPEPMVIELVRRAQKAEREACAKLCDDRVDAEYATGKVDHNEMGWTQACAIAIRSRGEK